MQTTDHNHQQHAPSALSQLAIGPEKLPAIGYIIAVGSGKGCGSSQLTLRQDLEVMVKRVAPKIKKIVDATNHSAGKQPLYPRHE